MKKVLIFHPTIAPYRIDFFNSLFLNFETHICLYYENLLDQTFEYDSIVSQFQFTPDYFSSIKRIGKHILPIGHWKRIQKHKPEIIITSEFGLGTLISLLYKAVTLSKTKVVVMCDDSLEIAKNRKSFHGLARRICVKKIDGLLVTNNGVEQFYRGKYNINHSFSFPIVHSEENYWSNKKEIKEKAHKILNKYHFMGKKVFIFVGRIAPEKNIEYLIRSFILFQNNNKNCILCIIGPVNDENKLYYESLREMVTSSGASDNILFVGRKDGLELKAWYMVGQVLILPSKYEPFGAVVGEALLAGEYVMVSDMAGAGCLVNDSNGEIIDISDPFIDFEKIVQRIPFINSIYLRESLLNVNFKTLMNSLCKWLDTL